MIHDSIGLCMSMHIIIIIYFYGSVANTAPCHV